MYVDSINNQNQNYALSALGNVIICTNAVSDAKTITLPIGYDYDSNLSIKVLFVNGHNCANSSTPMTLNGKSIVVNKYGSLIPLPINTIDEGGTTVYKAVQANTVLEMYYNSNYDGNGHGAFVVIGNPAVISNADYTIYADGSSNIDVFKTETVTSELPDTLDMLPVGCHFIPWEKMKLYNNAPNENDHEWLILCYGSYRTLSYIGESQLRFQIGLQRTFLIYCVRVYSYQSTTYGWSPWRILN